MGESDSRYPGGTRGSHESLEMDNTRSETGASALLAVWVVALLVGLAIVIGVAGAAIPAELDGVGDARPAGDGLSAGTDRAASASIPSEMEWLADTEVGFNNHSTALVTLKAPGPSEAFVMLAAYSRFNEVSPLNHDFRAEIADIVDTLPGIYLAQLVARTDRPTSTVRYHTRILEREGEIQRANIGGNLRLYPTHIDSNDFAYLAAIRDPATERVIAMVREHEPVKTGRLATLIDRAPSTVSHHLSRLEDTGVIERTRDGESVLVTLADDVDHLDTDPPEGFASPRVAP